MVIAKLASRNHDADNDTAISSEWTRHISKLLLRAPMASRETTRGLEMSHKRV